MCKNRRVRALRAGACAPGRFVGHCSAVSSYPLTSDELESYAEHGFVLRERAFGATEISSLCAAAERAVARAEAAVKLV